MLCVLIVLFSSGPPPDPTAFSSIVTHGDEVLSANSGTGAESESAGWQLKPETSAPVLTSPNGQVATDKFTASQRAAEATAASFVYPRGKLPRFCHPWSAKQRRCAPE